jgi:hypothetical protein
VDEWDIKRSLERQGDMHIKLDIQYNSEFQSLTSSPTQIVGPPRLKIDVQHAYNIGFGCSTYARKEEEVKFPIRFYQNCRNNFNIQSPTHLGAINIKTDAQVAYDIQLGCSWTPWKGNERSFPMELVPCLNSSGNNGDHRKNLMSRSWCCAAIFGLWAVYHV